MPVRNDDRTSARVHGARLVGLLLLALAACASPPVEIESLGADPFPGAAGASRSRLAAAQERVVRLEGAAEATPAERAAAWSDLGRLAHAFGYHATARTGYRNARRLAPRDCRWPYLEGLVENELGGPAAAVAAFDRALACDAMFSAARVARARALQALGRLDEAVSTIDEALRAAPTDAATLLFGAQIAADAGDVARAVERYEKLLELQPGADKLRSPLSLLYRRLGREVDADAALARSGPTPVSIQNELLAEVIALAPSDSELAARGDLAFRAGDLANAEAFFRAAASAAPDSIEHLLNLAAVELTAGRGAEADETLTRALAIEPRSSRAWFTRGVIRSRTGDAAGAVEAYRRALEIEPDDAGARQNLANTLLRSGRPAEALAEYRRLLAHDPSHSAGRVGVAASLLALGRSGEARRELERDFRPQSASPHLAGALARVLAAAPDAATRDGPRAVEIARGLPGLETHPVLLETLAMALAESGDLAGAIAAQERAVSQAGAVAGAAPPGMLERLEKNLALYRRGQACRDPALN